jgi:parvulin-like peptidyl-prolyl isomerase
MRSTAMAAVGLAMIASGALAQGTQSPSPSQPATEGRSTTEGAPVIPRAPIGHRQPTLKDLPPDMAQRQLSDEPLERPAAKGIDPVPRICRGC